MERAQFMLFISKGRQISLPLYCFAGKKKEADQQETEVKKKAKELKILDPKSAQNLCK
jgi:predicted GIY-YIG superfamily endonuclease